MAVRAFLAALLVVTVACGSGERQAPPTNPLATDRSTPSTPGSPAAGTGETGAPAAGPDAEAAAAQAIELMAEWLAIPAVQLRAVAAEPVRWPDACLGAPLPDEMCAHVESSGWRVLLLDAFDGAHAVHLGPGGAARWPGEQQLEGVVESVNVGLGGGPPPPPEFLGAVNVEPGGAVRFVLGTRGPLTRQLRPGQRIAYAVDTDPLGTVIPVVAWVVVLE